MTDPQIRSVARRIVSVVTGLMLSWVPLAHGTTCSQRHADAADAMIDHLDSWAQVNIMRVNFRYCDDGEIAEGISEAIARLLVDRWQTLPQLVALAKHNPQLKTFVLHHVDSTLDTQDLEKIRQLSISSCPPGARSLCKALAATASRSKQ